jgi:hypothetical protein
MAKKRKLPDEETPVNPEQAAAEPAKPKRASKLKAKKPGESPAESEPVREEPVEALGAGTAVSVAPAETDEDPEEAPITAAADPSADKAAKTQIARKKLHDVIEVVVRDSGVVRKAKEATHDAFSEASEVKEEMTEAADKVGSVVDKLSAKLEVMDTLIDHSLLDEKIDDAVSAPPEKKSSVPAWQQHRQTEQERAAAEKRSIEDQKRKLQEERNARDAVHLEKLRADRAALEAKQKADRESMKDRMRTEREAMDAKLKEERERKRLEREAYEAARKAELEQKESERKGVRRLSKDE